MRPSTLRPLRRRIQLTLTGLTLEHVSSGLRYRLGCTNETIRSADRDKIAALESRIRELTEWRPMESAPKDGTRVELAFVVGLDEFKRWETEIGTWGRTSSGYACSGWQDSRARPFRVAPGFWRPVGPLPSAGGGR